MSETAPDRREFLRIACGAGLILGLGQLGFGQDPQGKKGPSPFKQALARMRANRLDGLVIVIPEGAAAQAALGKHVQALVPLVRAHASIPEPAGRLLLQVVWVCASAEEVGAKPGETVVLIDATGKRVVGAKLKLGAKPKEVYGKLRTLIEGEGRFEARAKRSRQDPKIAAALADLRDPAKRGNSYSLLQANIAAAAPAIFAQLDAEQDIEVKRYLRSVLGQAYWRLINQTKAFPYGVSWKLNVNQPEPCPPCGMASPSISGRAFLRFFTR
ncbi:MAG: hypothetical protein JKY65_23910 [Planctomycetes bacterium]|nr:hypothetical protein [Planctomycetota bacterium]